MNEFMMEFKTCDDGSVEVLTPITPVNISKRAKTPETKILSNSQGTVVKALKPDTTSSSHSEEEKYISE